MHEFQKMRAWEAVGRAEEQIETLLDDGFLDVQSRIKAECCLRALDTLRDKISAAQEPASAVTSPKS